jgi:ABC-type transporter lipoprotein component MlaA
LFTLHISFLDHLFSTYDHRVWKIGFPVRSAILKPVLSAWLDVVNYRVSMGE